MVQVEKLYYTKLDDLSDEHDQLIALIKPYAEKLSQGYEAARLLELYSRTLQYEKIEGWQIYSDRAALLYEQINIIPRRASLGMLPLQAFTNLMNVITVARSINYSWNGLKSNRKIHLLTL